MVPFALRAVPVPRRTLVRARMIQSGAVGELMARLRETPRRRRAARRARRGARGPVARARLLAAATERYVDADGHAVELPARGSGRSVTPVERDGECVAAIIHDAVAAEGHASWSTRSAPPRRSRSRTSGWTPSCARRSRSCAPRARGSCEAGYEERRRLERDLHDGAQQRLVALALDAAAGARPADARPGRRRAAARRGGRGARGALDELRELARGIHPAVLSERGLAPALEALAARAPVPVELEGAARRAAAGGRRGGRLLRRRRGAHERGQVRASRRTRSCDVERVNGALVGRGARRRRGRRRPERGHRAARAGRSASRRSTGRLEIDSPTGSRNDRHGADPVRVVVADDSVLLREGVVRLLEEGGSTSSARPATRRTCCARSARHKPDVAVVDIRMPPTNTDEGLRAALRDPRRAARRPACWCCRSTSRRATRWSCVGDAAGGVDGTGSGIIGRSI